MVSRAATICISIFIILLAANIVFANGGDQRLVDNGRYYINLSRAPFTPRVGVKDSMLASFFDVQANRLIQEDLIVKIRISKLGGSGTAKRTFIFEQDNVRVKGGVLELPYTFTESGLHEVFFDFAFASNPKKVYEAPDFLIDVQKEAGSSSLIPTNLLAVIVALLIGFGGGWFLRKKMLVQQ